MSTENAFNRWVADHHAAVYRAAFRVVQNEHDALDVTQQVFVTALVESARVARADDAGAVLRYLAVKIALMHLRSDGARRRREREQAMEPNAIENEATATEASLSREQRSCLEQALARLPDALRAALILRYHEGLTLKAIAGAEDCSEPTVQDRIRRGLERLRHDLVRSGFPALAAGVEEQIGRATPAAQVTPVPPHLATDLLRLSHSPPSTQPVPRVRVTPAVAAGVKLAVVGGLVIAIGSAAWVALRPRTAQSARESAVAAAGPSAPRAPDVDVPERNDAAIAVVPSPDPAIAPRKSSDATLTGTVVFLHTRNGQPPPEVTIGAASAARDGKSPRFTANAPIDATGRFELAVPVERADGQDYALLVEHSGCVVRAPLEVRVIAGKTDVGTIEVATRIAEEPGAWALDLGVKTKDGVPLEDAIVRLSRAIPTYTGTVATVWEAGGRTDAAGRVLLEGTMLGPKSIEVDRVGDLTIEYGASFEVATVGPSRQDVTVEVTRRFTPVGDGAFVPAETAPRIAEVRGRMVDSATGEPLAESYPNVMLVAVQTQNADEFVADVVPSLLIPVPVQTAEFGTPPEPTDRFSDAVTSAGRYALVGRFDGRAAAIAGPFDLSDGMVKEDVVLRFEKPLEVTGIVTDADGVPIEGASVIVCGTGPISDARIAEADVDVRKSGGDGTHWFEHGRSGKDGRYVIGGLPPGVLIRVAALHVTHEPERSAAVRVAAGMGGVDVKMGAVRER